MSDGHSFPGLFLMFVREQGGVLSCKGVVKFSTWCRRNNIDPVSVTPSEMTRFLAWVADNYAAATTRRTTADVKRLRGWLAEVPVEPPCVPR